MMVQFVLRVTDDKLVDKLIRPCWVWFRKSQFTRSSHLIFPKNVISFMRRSIQFGCFFFSHLISTYLCNSIFCCSCLLFFTWKIIIKDLINLYSFEVFKISVCFRGSWVLNSSNIICDAFRLSWNYISCNQIIVTHESDFRWLVCVT